MLRPRHVLLLLILAALVSQTSLLAQSRQAPPGMFKDLNDDILGDAVIISGKQLFIDDALVAEMRNVTKQLHQPVKFDRNPVLKRDKPWEPAGPGYATLIYDPDEKLFKLWYENWGQKEATSALLMYATSPDGIEWTKPALNNEGTNQVRQPEVKGFQASGIFRDPRDPARRYKMIFSSLPDGTSKSLTTSVAFSPDGIAWTAEPEVHSIPFSDTQSCPLWDAQRQRYVAFMRFGPPNTRIISRTESEDFLAWSPKLTVLPQTKMDGPLSTQFYQMSPFAYTGSWFGVIAAYHTESLKPITDDAPWTDRKNLHLAYSRNGVTWTRVGKHGAIPVRELNQDKPDWKEIALGAVFVPYGEKDKDWDWGTVSPIFTPEPIIVGDEHWFYYVGINAKNWWTWTGDPPKLDPNPKEPDKGVGLAKLRLDGFVSVNAGADEGTLTTKPLVFLGDTLEINANAADGSIRVEALDLDGKPIAGFTKENSDALTTDSVRHVASWKGQADCHLLQGRPISLRFYLQNAQLYAFEPRVKRNHYLQSYD